MYVGIHIFIAAAAVDFHLTETFIAAAAIDFFHLTELQDRQLHTLVAAAAAESFLVKVTFAHSFL